jgi:hypothetical protein
MDPELLRGIAVQANVIFVDAAVWRDKTRRQKPKPKPAS